MNKKQKAYYVLEKMDSLFPEGQSELDNWETPFQFLVCIILSAQTTDKQVNKVTEDLFKAFPTAFDLSSASVEEVMELIGSINYYKGKSSYIIKTASIVETKFSGQVPDNIDDLLSLQGVGRKTANVYLNNLYQANEGIGADTHIIRTSQRLGLSRKTDADGVADDLERIYDQNDWHRVNNLFVLYGRYYCKARVKPGKSECVFKEDGLCSWCSGG